MTNPPSKARKVQTRADRLKKVMNLLSDSRMALKFSENEEDFCLYLAIDAAEHMVRHEWAKTYDAIQAETKELSALDELELIPLPVGGAESPVDWEKEYEGPCDLGPCEYPQIEADRFNGWAVNE